MKIGIIGLGVIGSACKYGFEKLGHNVIGHDIRLETKIEDVLDADICYVCVPTPSREDGSCDVSIVEKVVNELNDNNLSHRVVFRHFFYNPSFRFVYFWYHFYCWVDYNNWAGLA